MSSDPEALHLHTIDKHSTNLNESVNNETEDVKKIIEDLKRLSEEVANIKKSANQPTYEKDPKLNTVNQT